MAAGANAMLAGSDGRTPWEVCRDEAFAGCASLLPAEAQGSEVVPSSRKTSLSRAETTASATPDAVEAMETPQESSAEALELKSKGNESFRSGEWETACEHYSEALKHSMTKEDRGTILSNRSASFLKSGNAELALKDAQQSRRLRPEWHKACFREASAYVALKNLPDAAASYWEALTKEPGNDEYRSLFKRTMARAKREAGNTN